MLTPTEGVISFGAMVVFFLTSGILVLVNARRLHAWTTKQKLFKPTLGGLRYLGTGWIFLGLFCIVGVVHWASRV